MAPTDLRLSAKQEQSIAHATARINIWHGAIRSGKTIASLLRWLIYVASAPRGGQLVVTGKTTDTIARNVFGPLTDPMIVGPEIAKRIRYTRGAPTATILGRTIEVISANDARAEGRLRGMTCAGAYGDELTLLPEEFFTQLLGRMSVPGAQLFGTTNPAAPTHWLRKKFILRANEPSINLRYWHFTLDDNPGLDPGYKAAIAAEFVGLWYRRMVLGEWCLAEGAVFDMFDEDRHVVDTLPYMARWLALGIDYGTSNPFAGLMLGYGVEASTPRLWVAGEYRYDSKLQRRQLTDAEYSSRLRAWVADFPIPGTEVRGVRPEWTVVDPSAASFRIQLHQDGWPSVAADNSVLDGIRTMSSLLAADRLRIHRSCLGLLDELPGYSWDETAAANGVDAPIKTEDHSIDAVRYATHTTEGVWRSMLRLAA